jgi:hypothetical protein
MLRGNFTYDAKKTTIPKTSLKSYIIYYYYFLIDVIFIKKTQSKKKSVLLKIQFMQSLTFKILIDGRVIAAYSRG